MSHFNYFMLPTAPFPSFYYFSMPSITTIDPPPTETLTNINSESHIRTVPSQKSSLELSREELLAAGYDKKKKVWSSKEDEELL